MSFEIAERETAERLARRPWPATPIKSGLEASFEFFPPASAAARQKLAGCVAELAPLRPSFVSVTYGAGGTTRDRTLRTIEDLVSNTGLAVAGHLTCIGATAQEVDEVADSYLRAGVERIVALRGDPPSDSDDGVVPGGHRSAAELITAIRNRHDGDRFDIAAAAYPEVHPKAASAQADLDNVRAKVAAGADRLITQFFFDNDAFLRFRDAAVSAGIDIPIVAGIMPITNFERTARFAARCGTAVPDWMADLFAGLDEAPEIRRMIAATVAAEQCRKLIEHGVNRFHFYTLNEAKLSVSICRILGIGLSSAPVSADGLAS